MAANPAVSRTVAIVQGDAFQRQIQAALPRNVDMQRFARIVLTALNSSDALQRCSQGSILKACLEAAQDGLLPDGREGAIVPYKGEATWQPMVWGLVKLVRQSGELKDMGAEVIRSDDRFERWIDENGPHFRHEPNMAATGDALGVYAYARTLDGGFYVEVITWKEILANFRGKSQAGEKGPWKDWTDEMAKVRAIKRLCKRLPMSSDAQDVIDRDNRRDVEQTVGSTPVNPLAAINAAVSGQQQAEPATVGQLTDDPSPALDMGAIGAAQPQPQTVERQAAASRRQAAPASAARANPSATLPGVDPETGEISPLDRHLKLMDEATSEDRLIDLANDPGPPDGSRQWDEREQERIAEKYSERAAVLRGE